MVVVVSDTIEGIADQAHELQPTHACPRAE
jgi:hypothetical protein